MAGGDAGTERPQRQRRTGAARFFAAKRPRGAAKAAGKKARERRFPAAPDCHRSIEQKQADGCPGRHDGETDGTRQAWSVRKRSGRQKHQLRRHADRSGPFVSPSAGQESLRSSLLYGLKERAQRRSAAARGVGCWPANRGICRQISSRLRRDWGVSRILMGTQQAAAEQACSLSPQTQVGRRRAPGRTWSQGRCGTPRRG
jgi:hypothetical protein